MRTLYSLKKKIKNKNLVIVTKAEKGNTIVVRDCWEYTMKVRSVIEEYDGKIDNAFNLSFREAMNKSQYVLHTPRIRETILEPNPTPPPPLRSAEDT